MDRSRALLFPILIFLVFSTASSEVPEELKQGLVQFMQKLSSGNAQTGPNWGWNMSSDPCTNKWFGVTCDSVQQSVKRIILDKMNLTGVLDAAFLCKSKSLFVLSLEGNHISGSIPEEIGDCRHLTHIYLTSNNFSGSLPRSLAQLSNLRRIDISNNDFTGKLPIMSRMAGLLTLLVQNNKLTGALRELNFSSMEDFNVSNNNFSGPVPDMKGRFGVDRVSGNPNLCGDPLPNACPPSPAPSENKSKGSLSKKNRLIMYAGYIILAVVVIFFVVLTMVSNRTKAKKENPDVNAMKESTTSSKPTSTSSETKFSENKSEYSITSAAGGKVSSSLIVLSSPGNQLKFEDLLQAPAELLGKGKHGSIYKVMLDNGLFLVVKRIRDWNISRDEFKRRLQRIVQVKHPNILPLFAFYCSKQEKLLVYEYQPNGSLFKLLHGSQNGLTFDWGSRLNVAASIADALAFTHDAIRDIGISHGNLKSTNILFNKSMDPCISEYGLMPAEQGTDPSTSSENSDFKADIYALGVILLELLTGKVVQNNGSDLATWVNSVVCEEWTVEVFDKALISEGASEERMLNLLQVALKCINPSPNERPSISQVATMINVIKEEEQRSTNSVI